MKSEKITSLSSAEALRYLLDSKQYENFELPYYFDFKNILTVCKSVKGKKHLKSLFKKGKKPTDFNGVNHVILSNKDGQFGWRPLQLIHPILYVDLATYITETENWIQTLKLFKSAEATHIECISIPRISLTSESDKAEQISNWWDKIEQESIRKSLRYKHLFNTDISDCYGSIYTHSIEWVYHPNGRKGVKKDRASYTPINNMGTQIDIKIRNMNQGQSVGIPQGSTLMDFIAEIVLSGIDIEISQEIEKVVDDKDFSILRYRDDYRLFTNSVETGHEIMNIINIVLYKWGMKMNSSKTFSSDDLIKSSIKPEKIEQVYTSPVKQSHQKQALRIYLLSKKYPNAGIVAKELSQFYDTLEKRKRFVNFDYEVIISVITMIAYYSPKYIPQVSAVISKILEKVKDTNKKEKIIESIHKKFIDLPNSGLIDIWLQRITAPSNMKVKFVSEITEVAIGQKNNSDIWNCEWLKDEHVALFNAIEISSLDNDIAEKIITPVISDEEFKLFRRDEYDM